MRKALIMIWVGFQKGVSHLVGLVYTILVVMLLVLDVTLSVRFSTEPLAFFAFFLILNILLGLAMIKDLWETTQRKHLRIPEWLYQTTPSQVRVRHSKLIVYRNSIFNVYFICSTLIVVSAWLLFPQYLDRAEPLAFILTAMSTLTAFMTRQLRQRLEQLQADISQDTA